MGNRMCTSAFHLFCLIKKCNLYCGGCSIYITYLIYLIIYFSFFPYWGNLKVMMRNITDSVANFTIHFKRKSCWNVLLSIKELYSLWIFIWHLPRNSYNQQFPILCPLIQSVSQFLFFLSLCPEDFRKYQEKGQQLIMSGFKELAVWVLLGSLVSRSAH